MQRRRPIRSIVCLILLILAPAVSRGADILAEVPSDALGFVLIHKLTSVDAKIGQLATRLQRNLPRPLAFLKDVTGISDGLNAEGDFLLVLFPEANGNDQQLRFCVWLPVHDYDRFITSIGAKSIDGIAATTIAGEDLLVARRGDWALLMDPDQRDRITQLAAATPAQPTPQIAAWKDWTNTNDITLVAFATGVQKTLTWIEEDAAANNEPGPVEADDPFGALDANGTRAAIVALNAGRTSPDLFGQVKTEFQKWSAAAPELTESIQQANILGCGFRLDANGNALVSVRIAFDKELVSELSDDKIRGSLELPSSLYDSGGFVLSGAGRLPQSVLAKIATAYVRRAAADLKTDEQTELDESAINSLDGALEQAAADVRSAVVLSQPGAAPQPVYTNNFVALRVTSAKSFLGHAAEVMRLWNKANRDAKGETQLIFDVEEVKLGDHAATQYSIDIAGLEGGIVLPEVRHAMEKFFGPGGKMRFWIVPVNDNTVLLAAATSDQLTSMLKTLDRKQPIEWNRSEVSECNALLPAESDWRLFIDPHRYYAWLERQTSAVVGVPVIGGPLVKDFPASPPVGIAGGFRDGELWLEAASLAPTIKSADTYLTKSRARNSIRVRGRVFAPKPN